MTAYDVAAWTDFANTVAGGAATLGVTVAILLTAIFVATPGQDPRALAAEVGVLGLATAVGVIVGLRQQRSGEHPVRAVTSMLLLGVPALLLIVAAVSLWVQCGGGLYWVTAAVATGFVSATANAWVLLVEIRR
jgi:hypothetical protein